MIRVLLTACTFAAVLSAGAASARAEDLTGKLGIGADLTSAGAQGASLRYGLMPKLDLQLVLRFDYTSGPEDSSASELDLAVLAHYAVIEWTGLAFDVFGGISVLREASDNGVTDSSETDIGIEAGFGPNWFVTPNFALNLGLALVILIDDDEDEDQGATRISLFHSPEVVAFAGFTFWFR